MFWQLGYGHDGKTAAECAAFKSASLPSIVTVTVPAPAASPQQGTIPQSQPAVPGSVGEEIAKAAAAVGLTPKALRAIGPPWTDGKVPLTQIKDLNSEDISSVRQMLRGDVNAYSAQGITALSLVGNADDIDIIRIPLERPLPAAGPGSQVDGPRLRQLLRAKLAVPQALGVLGNRTKADRAVLALDQTKLLQNSLRLVGPTQALAMSLDSIKGLAIADTAAAQKSLDETLTQAHAPSAMPREQVLGILRNVPPEQSLAAALPPTTIPALAPEEIDSILALQRRVRSGGVDAIFEN